MDALVKHSITHHSEFVCEDDSHKWTLVKTPEYSYVVCKICEYNRWAKKVSVTFEDIIQHLKKRHEEVFGGGVEQLAQVNPTAAPARTGSPSVKFAEVRHD
jgi:hypothetical protein